MAWLNEREPLLSAPQAPGATTTAGTWAPTADDAKYIEVLADMEDKWYNTLEGKKDWLMPPENGPMTRVRPGAEQWGGREGWSFLGGWVGGWVREGGRERSGESRWLAVGPWRKCGRQGVEKMIGRLRGWVVDGRWR